MDTFIWITFLVMVTGLSLLKWFRAMGIERNYRLGMATKGELQAARSSAAVWFAVWVVALFVRTLTRF